MKQVIISTSKTDQGFSACCKLLPGWTATFNGTFPEFVGYVRESITSYVNGAKTSHGSHPAVFDTQLELLFKMDITAPGGMLSLSYRDR